MENVDLDSVEPEIKIEYIEMPISSLPITTDSKTGIVLDSESKDDSNAVLTESTSQGVSSQNAGHVLNSPLMQTSTSFDIPNDETPRILILSGRQFISKDNPNELDLEKISSHLATQVERQKKKYERSQKTLIREKKKLKVLESKVAEMIATRVLRRPLAESDDE